MARQKVIPFLESTISGLDFIYFCSSAILQFSHNSRIWHPEEKEHCPYPAHKDEGMQRQKAARDISLPALWGIAVNYEDWISLNEVLPRLPSLTAPCVLWSNGAEQKEEHTHTHTHFILIATPVTLLIPAIIQLANHMVGAEGLELYLMFTSHLKIEKLYLKNFCKKHIINSDSVPQKKARSLKGSKEKGQNCLIRQQV